MLAIDNMVDINLVHDAVQVLFPDVRVKYESEGSGGNHNFWLDTHEGIIEGEVSDVVNLVFNQFFISARDKNQYEDAFILTKFDLRGDPSCVFAISLPASVDEVATAISVLLRAKFSKDYISSF